MPTATPHRPRPRPHHRHPLRLRLSGAASRPRVHGLFLSGRRRQYLPREDAPGLGGGVGVAEPLHHRGEPDRIPVHVLDRASPPPRPAPPAAAPRVPPRQDWRRLRLDAGGVAPHLPLPPGPPRPQLLL